jgi:hypothetical protein
VFQRSVLPSSSGRFAAVRTSSHALFFFHNNLKRKRMKGYTLLLELFYAETFRKLLRIAYCVTRCWNECQDFERIGVVDLNIIPVGVFITCYLINFGCQIVMIH